MKRLLNYGLLFLIATGCNQKSGDTMQYNMASLEEENIPVLRQSPEVAPASEKIVDTGLENKKIIKDGRMGIRVDELEKTKTRTDSLIKANGGYYANENYTNNDYESAFQLKIRIPNTNFEKLISALETGEGEILYKEIDARDVTEEFIDLGIRLENKKNYLARYNEILKQARSIKEILDVEEKMRGLEEEIESAEGRLRYLSDQVAFSTLDLNITKRKEFRYNPDKRDSFFQRLKQSLSKGWFGFLDFLLFMIRVWPLWFLLVLGWYLWKRYRLKRKNKK